MARGRFISLEGLEGVGKTTNRDYIETLLKGAGINVLVTREPGGTPVGEHLRDLLLHSGGEMLPITELLLMAASRVEHVRQVIEPALQQGRWVLTDRFTDASFAYQGGGRELGEQTVASLHAMLHVNIEPDVTLLLDMPVEDGLKRMSARSEPDRIEKEAEMFFIRARAAYLKRAQDHSDRMVVVDASLPLADVQKHILCILQPIITSADA